MGLLSPPRWYDRWFPELARFGSEEARRRAFSAAQRKIGLRAVLWFVMFFLLWAFFLRHLKRSSGVPEWVELYVSPALTGLLVSVGLVWLGRRDIQRFLRKQLLERGVPICLRCGYDLRGQTEPRCPECGTPFEEALLQESTRREE